jgi:hypothetical protein
VITSKNDGDRRHKNLEQREHCTKKLFELLNGHPKSEDSFQRMLFADILSLMVSTTARLRHLSCHNLYRRHNYPKQPLDVRFDTEEAMKAVLQDYRVELVVARRKGASMGVVRALAWNYAKMLRVLKKWHMSSEQNFRVSTTVHVSLINFCGFRICGTIFHVLY